MVVWLMTGPFGLVVVGEVLAVIQATTTLSGWSTRWSRARTSTRSTSPETWATAMATTWRSRVVGERGGTAEQIVWNGSEQRGGDQRRHVVTGLGPLDDLGDGGVVTDRKSVDHVLGFGGHGCIVGGTPDTALTRRAGT